MGIKHSTREEVVHRKTWGPERLTLTVKEPSAPVTTNKVSHLDETDEDMPARLVSDAKMILMKFPVESNAAVCTAGGPQKVKLLLATVSWPLRLMVRVVSRHAPLQCAHRVSPFHFLFASTCITGLFITGRMQAL